jgi:hypothetical protein
VIRNALFAVAMSFTFQAWTFALNLLYIFHNAILPVMEDLGQLSITGKDNASVLKSPESSRMIFSVLFLISLRGHEFRKAFKLCGYSPYLLVIIPEMFNEFIGNYHKNQAVLYGQHEPPEVVADQVGFKNGNP